MFRKGFSQCTELLLFRGSYQTLIKDGWWLQVWRPAVDADSAARPHQAQAEEGRREGGREVCPHWQWHHHQPHPHLHPHHSRRCWYKHTPAKDIIHILIFNFSIRIRVDWIAGRSRRTALRSSQGWRGDTCTRWSKEVLIVISFFNFSLVPLALTAQGYYQYQAAAQDPAQYYYQPVAPAQDQGWATSE